MWFFSIIESPLWQQHVTHQTKRLFSLESPFVASGFCRLQVRTLQRSPKPSEESTFRGEFAWEHPLNKKVLRQGGNDPYQPSLVVFFKDSLPVHSANATLIGKPG